MKRILAYGDSNTWGFDSATFGQFSEDIRWTGLLQQALGEKAPVIEEGLCGRTTAFDDPECDGRNGLTALPAILEAAAPNSTAPLFLTLRTSRSPAPPTVSI